MERIKRTFKKLTIKKSFALLILLFLLLDIFYAWQLQACFSSFRENTMRCPPLS